MNNRLKIKFIASTGGNGLWSRHKAAVTVKEFEIHQLHRYNNKFVGELRVFFSTKEWNIQKYGLIYTDFEWLRQFRNKLIENGFSKKAANAVSYSEQGMQGDNYVSLDAGTDFIKEFAVLKTFGEIEKI
jgi:hypothetical protein